MSNETMPGLSPARVTPRIRAASWAPAAPWAATVAGLVGAIVLLHGLGRPGTEIVWADLPAWMADRSTEQAALALTRVLALVAAYCLALGTSIDMFARLAGLPALVRSVEWATLPPVRRMAEKVAAVAIGASMVPSIGIIGPPPVPDQRGVPGHTVVMVVDDVVGSTPVARPTGDPMQPPASGLPITLDRRVPAVGASRSAPAASAEADPPPHSATGAAATSGPPPLTFLLQDQAQADPETPPPGSPAALRAAAGTSGAQPARATATGEPSEHLVVPGEHLWGIAAGRLTAAHGRAPSVTETANYWSEIVAANRTTLRSGDPDLIFPGETITCPPVSAGP